MKPLRNDSCRSVSCDCRARAAALVQRYFAIAMFICALPACAEEPAHCPADSGVTLQVLGSGGPVADDARASSSYLIWLDGNSRVLIDAGGGTFLRFGEARASFSELRFVGLSHYHTDHSADLPALLKSGSFSQGEDDLTVAGPDGSGAFPGLGDYLQMLLRPDGGAYAYLAGYLDGAGGMRRLVQQEVGKERQTPLLVFDDTENDIRIDAMQVPHGIVPAVAFRVVTNGRTIVFSSDQNGTEQRFIEFATDADILVMHMVVPLGVTGPASRLHATPDRIGEIASQANARALVLSHFMARSLRELDENVAAVRSSYKGRIIVAEDLGCVTLP